MSGLIWLVRKDLALFFADKQGALMTVLVPVVMASLLGMLLAPRSSGSVLELLVVAPESTPELQHFVKALSDSENFQVTQIGEAEARRQVTEGEASLALILPKGSSQALRPEAMFEGKQQEAELLYDPSDEVEASMATGLLTQVLMQETMGRLTNQDSMGQMFAQLNKDLGDDADPRLRSFLAAGKSLADRQTEPKGSGAAGTGGKPTASPSGGGMQPPIHFKRHAAAPSGPASGFNSYAHNFAGMLMMFLLFAAQSRAKHLVNEREGGTLMRLRLCQVSDRMILLGFGLSTALIALLASAVVYAVGLLVFKIQILGSLPGFLGVLIAQALFVGAFALLLAGLGKSEEQIGSIGTFAVLLMSFAGGAMIPSFLMPSWLISASRLLPTFWATHGLAAMTWRGFPLVQAALPIGALLLFAALCTLVGLRRFRFTS